MDIGEILGDALRYPLSDPKKLFMFGIIFVIATLYSNFTTQGAANIALILFLLIFALLSYVMIGGYQIRILRGTMAGFDELPEFDDLLDMFVDGLKVVVVGIICAIPLVIVIGLLFYGLVFAPVGLTNLSVHNPSAIFFIAIFAIIVILIILLLYPLILMMLANMVYNNSKIESAFKFGEIFNKISNIGWGNFLLWYIVIGIIYLIISVIGLVIMAFFNLIHLKIVGGVLYPLIIGSYMAIFIYRAVALFYISGDHVTRDLGYLECDNCRGYYELQDGESPDDFNECECGGKLTYINK
jgi:hypothetical protein